MVVTPPTEEEFQAMLAELAYRYPEKAAVTVPGDGGTPVRLPLVLGNPTGSCTLPPGARATPAWAAMIAVTMKLRPDAPAISEQLVDDCILWPDRKTWASWVQRWPGLPAGVLRPVRQKFGASLDGFEEPHADEAPPESIAKLLSEKPRAIWRRLKIRGQVITVVLEPPSSTSWRLFVDAVRDKKNGDSWPLVRELTLRSTCGFDGVESGIASFGEVLERWPGVAMLIVAAVAELIGVDAESELGNF